MLYNIFHSRYRINFLKFVLFLDARVIQLLIAESEDIHSAYASVKLV